MTNGCRAVVAFVAVLASTSLAAPPAPTGLAATPGNGTVTLAWNTPGAAVTGHQVRYGTGDPVRYHRWVSLASATGHTFVDLDKGVLHTFQVRAEDINGRGPSAQVSATPQNGVATVGELSITSTPASGDTYRAGEIIHVRVRFDEPVVVVGRPQLAVTIGAEDRLAGRSNCHRRSGPAGTCRRLGFRYVVVASDRDADGVSVAADALRLNDASIEDMDGSAADLNFGTLAISNAAQHKVEGQIDSAPGVSGVSIASTPASGDAYAAGETITVRVSFDETVVVTGSPLLTLDVGAHGRTASRSGCHRQNADAQGSCRRLAFSYVVQASDEDEDGIGVAADALDANGGTIRDSGGNDADLGLGAHAISAASAHKVRPAAVDAAPSVSGVAVASTPASGDAYAAGETITVRVSFDEAVVVTGSPLLTLDVGGRGRAATRSGCHRQNADAQGSCRRLAFSYVVQAADEDEDGIGVAADALDANGGTIRDSGGNDADLGLGAHAISAASAHKVRPAAVDAAPSVSGVAVASTPASGDAYATGETITVRVSFDEAVVVTGSPLLTLDVGGRGRAATRSGCHRQNADAQGSCRRLAFSYVVQASDEDEDGIGVAADALDANGGTIRDSGGNDADLGLGAHAISAASAHKVRPAAVDAAPSVSGVAVASTPASGDAYAPGETITVRVSFDEAVVVTGSPLLTLDVGAHGRAASRSGCHRQNADAQGSCRRLAFSYVVQASDEDEDGIGVAADALDANGGTIRDSGGNDADLGLGAHAISAASAHKVRPAAVDAAPSVSGVAVASTPASGDAYAAGETITVRVSFDEAVVVTGSPLLTLDVGGRGRAASRSGCHRQNADAPGSCRRLAFSYVVQAADEDEDGIGVAADALDANGGTIRDSGGNDADLDLGAHAISAASAHKVRGSVDTAPTVFGLSIYSTPERGDTYHADERIRVRVWFSEPVLVTGRPQLTIGVGSGVRTAVRAGCHRQNADPVNSCRRLAFEYLARLDDLDDDGISLHADAFDLNGGSVRDVSGNDADLDLTRHAIADDPAHKVAGVVDAAPQVDRVAIASAPASGGVYAAGETITVRVWFNEPVLVTRAPTLVLTIGSNSRAASRSGCHRQNADPEGSCRRLAFAYGVRPEDLDQDGIGLAADALRTNGGGIEDIGGNTANLNLGRHAFARDPAHKVDGGADGGPNANAGSDRWVSEGQAVVLGASGASASSAQGGAASLTHSWRQSGGRPVALDSVRSPRAGFVAPTQLPSETRLMFELTVANAEGATATDEVAVVVAAGPNDPPTARAGVDRTVAGVSRVALDASGSTDPEGESLTYQWQQAEGPTVVLSSPSSPRPTFTTPTASGEAVLVFSLVVTDERGAPSAPDQVSVTVANSAAPTFGDASIGPLAYVVGEPIAPFTLPTAIGGDRPVSYRLQPLALPDGLALAVEERRISGTPTTPVGRFYYAWFATDADGDTAQLAFSISVASRRVNRVPEATAAIPDLVLPDSAEAMFDLSTLLRDADGDPLSYAIDSTAGDVATASALGSLMVVSAVAAGTAESAAERATTVAVVATDPEGASATSTFGVRVVGGHVDIELEPGGAPLTLTQEALFAIRAGAMTARSNRPDLASVAVQEGLLTFVPGIGSEGVAIISVVVEQADGWRVSIDLPVVVGEPTRPFLSGWRACLLLENCTEASADNR